MSSHAMVTPSKPDSDKAPRRTSRPVVTLRPAKQPSPHALGGEPRVSLLPNEVNDFQRARHVRRRLTTAVAVVAVVAVVGVGASSFLASSAQSQLEAARAEQAALVAQEAQFADLRAAKTGIALIQAGQYVGASTEIDWKAYLESLQATLPAGVQINSVTVDSASPFVDYAQSTVPLEGSRVATLVFTASSPGLPSIPGWLDGLGTLKGFADAVPGSVTVQDDGSYLANITMHINSDAFAKRFPGEKK